MDAEITPQMMDSEIIIEVETATAMVGFHIPNCTDRSGNCEGDPNCNCRRSYLYMSLGLLSQS